MVVPIAAGAAAAGAGGAGAGAGAAGGSAAGGSAAGGAGSGAGGSAAGGSAAGSSAAGSNTAGSASKGSSGDSLTGKGLKKLQESGPNRSPSGNKDEEQEEGGVPSGKGAGEEELAKTAKLSIILILPLVLIAFCILIQLVMPAIFINAVAGDDNNTERAAYFDENYDRLYPEILKERELALMAEVVPILAASKAGKATEISDYASGKDKSEKYKDEDISLERTFDAIVDDTLTVDGSTKTEVFATIDTTSIVSKITNALTGSGGITAEEESAATTTTTKSTATTNTGSAPSSSAGGPGMVMLLPPQNIIDQKPWSWQPRMVQSNYSVNLSKSANQFKLANGQMGYTMTNDSNNLARIGTDYVISMGTYYTGNSNSCVGTNRYRITMKKDDGKTYTFTGIIGDVKSDAHTDPTHRYHTVDHSIIEFHAWTRSGPSKSLGSIFPGKISKIEVIAGTPGGAAAGSSLNIEEASMDIAVRDVDFVITSYNVMNEAFMEMTSIDTMADSDEKKEKMAQYRAAHPIVSAFIAIKDSVSSLGTAGKNFIQELFDKRGDSETALDNERKLTEEMIEGVGGYTAVLGLAADGFYTITYEKNGNGSEIFTDSETGEKYLKPHVSFVKFNDAMLNNLLSEEGIDITKTSGEATKKTLDDLFDWLYDTYGDEDYESVSEKAERKEKETQAAEKAKTGATVDLAEIQKRFKVNGGMSSEEKANATKDAVDESSGVSFFKLSRYETDNYYRTFHVDGKGNVKENLVVRFKGFKLLNDGGAGTMGGDVFWDGTKLYYPLPPQFKTISSPFGYRTSPITGISELHNGLDLPAPAGTPIYAVADGTVVTALRGYNYGMGNYVEIDHGNGLLTRSQHMTTILTAKGAKVKAGQVIGTVGTTGASTGNHLHYSVKINGSWVNPKIYTSMP